MRRLLIAVWVFSVAALSGIYVLFDIFTGSYAVRLQVPSTEALRAYIKQLSDEGENVATYALTRSDALQMEARIIHEMVVCEYFALDRTGMGITLVSGRYPKNGEMTEAIISDKTAQALHPTMECIGKKMVIWDRIYQIVGIFSQRRIAGFTPVPMDVMIPAEQEGRYETVFIWSNTKEKKGSMLRALEGLSSPDSYPGTEVIDLHSCALAERQWIACVMVFMVCIYASCLWEQARRQRRKMPRNTNDSIYAISASKWYYGKITCILADWRSMVVMAMLCGAAVWLFKTMYLPPDSLPDNLLSPIAWYKILRVKIEQEFMQNTFCIAAVQRLFMMKKACAIFVMMAVMSGAGYVLVNRRALAEKW